MYAELEPPALLPPPFTPIGCMETPLAEGMPPNTSARMVIAPKPSWLACFEPTCEMAVADLGDDDVPEHGQPSKPSKKEQKKFCGCSERSCCGLCGVLRQLEQLGDGDHPVQQLGANRTRSSVAVQGCFSACHAVCCVSPRQHASAGRLPQDAYLYLTFQSDVLWAVAVAAIVVLVLMPVHAAVRQVDSDVGQGVGGQSQAQEGGSVARFAGNSGWEDGAVRRHAGIASGVDLLAASDAHHRESRQGVSSGWQAGAGQSLWEDVLMRDGRSDALL